MTEIRDETPADHPAIREVNRLAFEGDLEARLVDRLRAEGLGIASLVAVEDGQVVGHIFFSELPIETEAGVLRAASLAPMAVRPERQRQGIGSALVRAGLEACRQKGYSIVVVVGHPGYYPRFGFAAELAQPLQSPYAGEAFMALELVPRALYGIRGTVRYPRAFENGLA
jgi:putative acetyltransferase